MRGLGDEVGGILLYGFQDDFHVFELLGAGDDDGLIEMIILPFGKDKTNIFGFVGRDTFAVNKDAGVEAKFVAVENHCSVGHFVNAVF